MGTREQGGGDRIERAKQAIVEIGRYCWQKGWVAANDGNISLRISENEILCTPTGVSKGMMHVDQICMVDSSGTLLNDALAAPSSEIKMHLRVMQIRPDINSVVHAHPPFATAHAVAGIPFTECVLPEIVIGLGSIPIAPYGTPSTNEIPDRLEPLIANHDAWLLENHGALTAGADLYQAYFRMESLELYAQMMSIARGLGRVNTLNDSQVDALVKLRGYYGVPNKDNIYRGA